MFLGIPKRTVHGQLPRLLGYPVAALTKKRCGKQLGSCVLRLKYEAARIVRLRKMAHTSHTVAKQVLCCPDNDGVMHAWMS